MLLKSCIILPGQAFLLHLRLRAEFPTHPAPPLEGGGLSHCRYSMRVPPPQVCEQGELGDRLQELHRPSTAK